MTYFENECDVLVLGAGPAGSSAALSARAKGATVVVVESRAEVGGNAQFSSGLVAFAATPVQEAVGITDSADAFLADMEAAVERQHARFAPTFDRSLGRLFAGRSSDAYAFLDELGFQFGRFVPRPVQHRVTRLIAVEPTSQFNRLFAQALSEQGVTCLLHSYAEKLVVERGRIAGAVVRRSDGAVFELRGRQGVVVALGGYQASQQLRRTYQPTQDPRAPYPGLSNMQGDGHLMMEAVGAELVNMHMIPRLVRGPSRFVEEVIAVNGYGKRFEDEAGPYDARLEQLLAQPESIGYYVWDAQGDAGIAHIVADLGIPVKEFTTIAQVAAAIGCDEETLEATVRRWNETVDGGAAIDAEFGRVVFPEPRRGLSTAPFRVMPMIPGIACSVGGARVNSQMQVLSEGGAPIPGLYAAGDCVGLINPATGLGGIHIASAVTLGLVAGECVAQAA